MDEWTTMKVLLLNPPFDCESIDPFFGECLGLGYVASALRRDGHEVEVFDSRVRGMGLGETMREVLSREFDFFGVTALDAHKRNLQTIAQTVRKHKKGAVILAGGYLATLNAERLLTACPEIDFVVRGEGEAVAPEVIGRIARAEDWRSTPGVAYLLDGAPVVNPPAPLIQDLDSLPFPSRDSHDQTTRVMPAQISGSRGCYHRCSFCCVNSFYGISGNHPPRYRSAENVLDELESVVTERGIKSFGFLDDDFLGPSAATHERAVKIAEGIKSRKLDITFSMECRVDEVDEDMLRLLKDAGLVHVLLGVESGVQRQLDTYNKRATVEQNRQAIEMVRRVGLRLTSGFIMLDPYVTMAETLQNIEFMREMKLVEEGKIAHIDYLMKLTLYHGVPLMEKVQADGLLRENGLDVDYVFKDRQFRMMYRLMTAFRGLSKCVQRAQCVLTRRRRSDG